MTPVVAQLVRRQWVRAVVSGTVTAAGAAVLLAVFRDPVAALVDPDLLRIGAGGAVACSLGLLTGLINWRPGVSDGSRRTAMVLARTPAVLACLLPILAVVYVAGPQIRALESAYVDAPRIPAPLAENEPTAKPGTAPTNDSEEVRKANVQPFNLLLIGGDAGPGRWGLRTDSLNLVSIHPDGQQATLIGIPRNLYGAPMPAGPLRKKFPDGFPDLINAVYGWGSDHEELVGEALGATQEPGAALVAAVVAELTGQPVDAFLLVDMQGFAELVDALGGVRLNLDQPATLAVGWGNTSPKLSAGEHRLDGVTALAYARNRSGDGDYARMNRQRCLLRSMATSTTALDVLRRWEDITEVVARRIRTNLTPGRLRELTGSAQGIAGNVKSIGLTPPLVPSAGWDLADVRDLVTTVIEGEVQAAPEPVAPPVSAAGGPGITVKPDDCS